MEKQNIEQVVDNLLASRQNVTKEELRAVVELVLNAGGEVVAAYAEDGPWCGTRFGGRPPKLGEVIDTLTAKRFTVKIFPFGIIDPDGAYVQIGREALT
jgi:hypothetical protein